MKKRIIGIIVAVLGLLLSLGPQFLFKVCDSDPVMKCHWTAQAEIGIGIIIFLLGISLVIFKDIRIRLGLSIGIFLSGVYALLLPHMLIGGCIMPSMPCHTTAFPAITVICIVLLVSISFNLFFIFRKISKQ